MSDIYKQRQHEVEKELEHIEMLNNIIPAFEDYTKEVDEFIDRIIKSDIEQLNEKDKEIERLNKQVNEALIVCNDRQKEIVRLDNMIRELEKYIENSKMQGWIEYNEALEDILDKIKELKESSK